MRTIEGTGMDATGRSSGVRNEKRSEAIPRPVRCAAYCRKSTVMGLEQEFNSLDAQRVACEAYIASMRGEGWVCLPTRYDDGGYSGGNADRPALKRLLDDIDAGRVDVVVVVKVDRLSRSLLDFAQMMNRFNERGVSFVSTTQQFNTASSMGRLTLNMLLSFAQFERELIAERTRDKIALSRQRGRWTGGRPVLGYDIAAGTRLVVNAAEAEVVRWIFSRYVECESLMTVCRELAERGVVTKSWTSKRGVVMGGKPITKGRLWSILSNPLYAGRIAHHGKLYEGLHERIVDEELFARVQRVRARNRFSGENLPGARKAGGALCGLIRCKRCNTRMGHSTTKGQKRRGGANAGGPRPETAYRYYVCASRSAGGAAACRKGLVPAAEIERFVLEKCRSVLTNPELQTAVLDVLRRRDEAASREVQTGVGAARTRFAEPLATRESVRSALSRLEDLWSVLTPTEQRSLLRHAIGEVRYDGEGGQIDIDFRDGWSRWSDAAGVGANEENGS